MLNLRLKFAPFNQLLGQEVEHDASARLIHEEDGETMEAFAESHFHDTNVEVEEVEVVRFARFITDIVATRRLPNSAQVTKPRVVIKVKGLMFFHAVNSVNTIGIHSRPILKGLN